MTDETDSTGFVRLKVVKGSVDSISLFEITDWELEVLEKGAPGSTLLNFGVFFLSAGLSFLASLLALTTTSTRTFLVFLVLSVLGIGSGIVLLILWRMFGTSTADVCKRIRARVPSVDAAPEEIAPSAEPTQQG